MCLTHCFSGQVTNHVTCEVGLEKRQSKLCTHLQQAEWGIIMQRHLEGAGLINTRSPGQ